MGRKLSVHNLCLPKLNQEGHFDFQQQAEYLTKTMLIMASPSASSLHNSNWITEDLIAGSQIVRD
jgi:hypothetical protein